MLDATNGHQVDGCNSITMDIQTPHISKLLTQPPKGPERDFVRMFYFIFRIVCLLRRQSAFSTSVPPDIRVRHAESLHIAHRRRTYGSCLKDYFQNYIVRTRTDVVAGLGLAKSYLAAGDTRWIRRCEHSCLDMSGPLIRSISGLGCCVYASVSC